MLYAACGEVTACICNEGMHADTPGGKEALLPVHGHVYVQTLSFV